MIPMTLRHSQYDISNHYLERMLELSVGVIRQIVVTHKQLVYSIKFLLYVASRLWPKH
jgi:hypothetical protein